MPWAENLYQDQKFITLVIKKLKSLSNADFIESFLKNINIEEEKAKTLISIFDPLYLPDVEEKITTNSQQINYILNLPHELEAVLLRNEKK